MRFYEIVVGQLDLAAELLQEQQPMRSRLALILVDNAAEYAVHRFAADRFLLNSIPGQLPVAERREQYRRRAEIGGQHLGPKISFAQGSGAATQDQASFIRDAHRFRNQAYHAGRAHDAIVTELVTAYYSLLCQMLPNLAPKMLSFRLDDGLSPRVERHMRKEAALPLPDPQAIAESLLLALPQPEESLASACRSSLTGWLAEVRTIIDYLVRNEPGVKDASSLILDTQFWNAFWGRAPEEGLTFLASGSGDAEVDPDQKAELEKAVAYMRESWRPEVSLSTLERWESRIARLASAATPGLLLQTYCKLVSEIEPFMTMVSRRCAAFDRYVESVQEERGFSSR